MTTASFPCRRSATQCPPAAWCVPQPVMAETVRLYRAEVEQFRIVYYRTKGVFPPDKDRGSPPPILLRFALHRWVLWILAFDPITATEKSQWSLKAIGKGHRAS